jgi:hypothetical protein
MFTTYKEGKWQLFHDEYLHAHNVRTLSVARPSPQDAPIAALSASSQDLQIQIELAGPGAYLAKT